MYKMLSKKELGERIKLAREIKGKETDSKFSSQKLADYVGISRSYMTDIENGRGNIKFAIILSIAKACNVPINFFESDFDMEGYVKLKESGISPKTYKEKMVSFEALLNIMIARGLITKKELEEEISKLENGDY